MRFVSPCPIYNSLKICEFSGNTRNTDRGGTSTELKKIKNGEMAGWDGVNRGRATACTCGDQARDHDHTSEFVTWTVWVARGASATSGFDTRVNRAWGAPGRGIELSTASRRSRRASYSSRRAALCGVGSDMNASRKSTTADGGLSTPSSGTRLAPAAGPVGGSLPNVGASSGTSSTAGPGLSKSAEADLECQHPMLRRLSRGPQS